MKYIDRDGNITVEETGQDAFLRHLYNDRGGRICLGILIRPWVSVLGGAFLSSPLSRGMIRGFVKRNHIDMSEYEEEKYRSYNDFFIRRIKEGKRPLPEDASVLVSPCDAKLTVWPVTPDRHFRIKDTDYTLESLLRSRKLAERFAGGCVLVFRLTVDNYHHYVYPVSGRKSAARRIGGVFHTVNPAANDLRPIYVENTREYCLIRSEKAGTVLQMEVGALMVGKIVNQKRQEAEVTRGEEKGYFAFGGSTVILVVQKDRVRIDRDLLKNTREGFETTVKMGERIGECQLSEGA